VGGAPWVRSSCVGAPVRLRRKVARRRVGATGRSRRRPDAARRDLLAQTQKRFIVRARRSRWAVAGRTRWRNECPRFWIPAFAGMTSARLARCARRLGAARRRVVWHLGRRRDHGRRLRIASRDDAHTRLIAVNHVRKGERIGYSATWTMSGGHAGRRRRDRLRRRLSAPRARGHAGVAQRPTADIVGRVSMDLMTLDLRDTARSASPAIRCNCGARACRWKRSPPRPGPSATNSCVRSRGACASSKPEPQPPTGRAYLPWLRRSRVASWAPIVFPSTRAISSRWSRLPGWPRSRTNSPITRPARWSAAMSGA
jgi:hypothetical protein